MINGLEQPVGHKYRADKFEATENEIRISYPQAYPSDALINGLTRSLELTDSALLIKDTFDFADGEKQSLCEVLMSVLPINIENNTAVIDGRYRISASVGSFRYERIPFEDGTLERDWKTDACYRLLLECEGEKQICMKVEKI
jgi:hypothetical protein